MLSGAYVLTNKLAINGEFNSDVSQNIYAALMEETTEGLYRCEIELLNFSTLGYLYFARNEFDFGAKIQLSVGLGSQDAQLFQGYITGLEASYIEGGGSRLTILAEDKLQNLRMVRRTRTFEDVSDEDVMQLIAQEHSLETAFDSLSGPTYRVLAQTNLSDLAFLRQCARRLNSELWLENNHLHVAPRSARGAERIQLAYGANLRSFQVRADLAHQCTEVSVGGWDVQAKEAIHERAEESAVNNELGGGRSGASILREFFGERKQSIVHTVPLSSAEAKAVAEARYRETARKFVTGTGLADGDPKLRVGAILELSQMGSMFDGEYYVVRSCHTFGHQEGYRTEFDVERAAIGQE
jgi:uncharacterized protein